MHANGLMDRKTDATDKHKLAQHEHILNVSHQYYGFLNSPTISIPVTLHKKGKESVSFSI